MESLFNNFYLAIMTHIGMQNSIQQLASSRWNSASKYAYQIYTAGYLIWFSNLDLLESNRTVKAKSSGLWPIPIWSEKETAQAYQQAIFEHGLLWLKKTEGIR